MFYHMSLGGCFYPAHAFFMPFFHSPQSLAENERLAAHKKNTGPNHKLRVGVAQTFLRGRASLEAEITPLVGGNLRWEETKD